MTETREIYVCDVCGWWFGDATPRDKSFFPITCDHWPRLDAAEAEMKRVQVVAFDERQKP